MSSEAAGALPVPHAVLLGEAGGAVPAVSVPDQQRPARGERPVTEVFGPAPAAHGDVRPVTGLPSQHRAPRTDGSGGSSRGRGGRRQRGGSGTWCCARRCSAPARSWSCSSRADAEPSAAQELLQRQKYMACC